MEGLIGKRALVAGGAGWLGAALAALTVLPVLLAPLGLLSAPGRLGRLMRTPLYLFVVNAAALAGLWRGLTGCAPAVWEVPVSTRSTAAGAASPRSNASTCRG